MSEFRSGSTKNRIKREADSYGIELDAIRTVDSDGRGTVFRVLETDADDEVNQVGFQVQKMPNSRGPDMFENRLQDGLRQLRDVVRDGSTDSEPRSIEELEDNEADDTDESTSSSTEDESVPNTVERVEKQLGLRVTMDDESLETFRDELEALLDEQDDTDARLTMVEDDIDDLDGRITSIEQTLSAIGGD